MGRVETATETLRENVLIKRTGDSISIHRLVQTAFQQSTCGILNKVQEHFDAAVDLVLNHIPYLSPRVRLLIPVSGMNAIVTSHTQELLWPSSFRSLKVLVRVCMLLLHGWNYYTTQPGSCLRLEICLAALNTLRLLKPPLQIKNASRTSSSVTLQRVCGMSLTI